MTWSSSKSEMGHGQTRHWGLRMRYWALPFLPLFLLEKGEDARFAGGEQKSPAYLNGDVPLDRNGVRAGATGHWCRPARGPATVNHFFEKTSTMRALTTVGVLRQDCAGPNLPSGGGYLKIQLPRRKYSLRSNDEQTVELASWGKDKKPTWRWKIVTHGLSCKRASQAGFQFGRAKTKSRACMS